MKNILDYETVSYDTENNKLVIIDQTKLPNDIELLYLDDRKDIYDAICALKVRGAPAIGVAAAIAIAVMAQKRDTQDYMTFREAVKSDIDCLASSRPTAVNLFWALERMENILIANRGLSIDALKNRLRLEALKIWQEDIDVCRKIGENGLSLLKPGEGILTHCNAGQLAAVKYGTALAPVYAGHLQGYAFKVYCDETRPLLQGARLSSFELASAGVDTTVICDNMAASLMSRGNIQTILVGCDRVAANGDAANKIGTLGVAVLANYFHIPFYICAPSSTMDLKCASGDDIKIELRNEDEIRRKWYEKPMVHEHVKAYNPAFDVTPGKLITGFITEYGIISPPFNENIRKILDEKGKEK